MDRHSKEQRVGPDLDSRQRRIDDLLAGKEEQIFVQGEVVIDLSRHSSSDGKPAVVLIRCEEGMGLSMFTFEPGTNTVTGTDNGISGSQFDFDGLLAGMSRKQCPVGKQALQEARLELMLNAYGQLCRETGTRMFESPTSPFPHRGDSGERPN